MKTYRNEKLGFTILIPEEWSFDACSPINTAIGQDYSITFKCGAVEAFNLQIGKENPEPSLQKTEKDFRQYAEKMGYLALQLGRLTSGGKEHVWARYYMGNGVWAKKYMIVLSGIEYAITATCFDQKIFLQREPVWDATAESFQIIRHIPPEMSGILLQLSQPTKLSDMPERIALCKRALALVSRLADPYLWAMIEIEFAKGLGQNPKGDRADNIEKSINHFYRALEVVTRDANPEDWATIQNNLASCFRNRVQGDRAENIEQAIQFCQQALEVRIRQAHPEEWATTHNNLANAYRDRLRGDRAENQEQAISHCQQSLEAFTPQAHPWKWAAAQNNLANAFQDRLRGNQGENIEQAIHHYQQAMQVFIREAYPEEWAWTHSNLATAYRKRVRGNQVKNRVVAQ